MKTLPILAICVVSAIFCWTNTSHADDGDTLTLICTAEPSKRTTGFGKTDFVHKINFYTKQVDGFDATITDDEIFWYKSESIFLVINRQTGSYRIGNEQFPILLQGSCEKAANRKF